MLYRAPTVRRPHPDGDGQASSVPIPLFRQAFSKGPSRWGRGLPHPPTNDLTPSASPKSQAYPFPHPPSLAPHLLRRTLLRKQSPSRWSGGLRCNSPMWDRLGPEALSAGR
eukprot:10372745-Alexandrium_andersonii.AAC.1